MKQINPQDILVGDVLLIPAIDESYPLRIERIIAPHSDAGPYVRVFSMRPGDSKAREVIVPWYADVVRLDGGYDLNEDSAPSGFRLDVSTGAATTGFAIQN
jgi:hypothetical protein